MRRNSLSRAEQKRWDRETLRDPHAQPDKADRVEAMFDAIAPTYERFNTVASLGRDAVWRRRAVEAAEVRAGDVALDICCGTGDMVRALAQASPRRVIGVDFSTEMLALGDFAGVDVPIDLIRADALRLPLADASVDVISCAFGVRNFGDVQAGLHEMARVARAGARVIILEFATPANALLRLAHGIYCRRILPLVSALLVRDAVGAYRYLTRSIETFETTTSVERRLNDAGFGEVGIWRMNLGGVVLYRGVKGQDTRGGQWELNEGRP